LLGPLGKSGIAEIEKIMREELQQIMGEEEGLFSFFCAVAISNLRPNDESALKIVTKSEPLLREVLITPSHWSAKLLVCRVIGNMKVSKETRLALVNLTFHRDETVRTAAREALKTVREK
jgi:hypothetical protein